MFTSESASQGHPDKMADQISDAILSKDYNARIACEVCVTTGFVLIFGEISKNAYVDIQKVVRNPIKEIGFTNSKYGVKRHFIPANHYQINPTE